MHGTHDKMGVATGKGKTARMKVAVLLMATIAPLSDEKFNWPDIKYIKVSQSWHLRLNDENNEKGWVMTENSNYKDKKRSIYILQTTVRTFNDDCVLLRIWVPVDIMEQRQR